MAELLSPTTVGGVPVATTDITSLLAPKASPAFTGTPTAPTPAAADNTTKLATTAFVKNQGYAPLASPGLTGTPTAPTPSTPTNSGAIATTNFVRNAIAAYAPQYSPPTTIDALYTYKTWTYSGSSPPAINSLTSAPGPGTWRIMGGISSSSNFGITTANYLVLRVA